MLELLLLGVTIGHSYRTARYFVCVPVTPVRTASGRTGDLISKNQNLVSVAVAYSLRLLLNLATPARGTLL